MDKIDIAGYCGDGDEAKENICCHCVRYLFGLTPVRKSPKTSVANTDAELSLVDLSFSHGKYTKTINAS